MDIGEASEFGLHGLPQLLVNNPELRVFDDLPLVRRTQVHTATPGQGVLDEEAATEDEAADVFLIQQNDADTTGRPAFSARASPGRLCRKRDHLFVESMGDTPQADAAGEPSRDLFDDARLGGLNLQSRAERKRVTVGRDASSTVIDGHGTKAVGA